MQLKDIPGDHVARVNIGGQGTAGTADVWALLKAPADIKITGVTWIPNADVTGDNTNYFSLKAQNEGTDGTGTTAVTATKDYTTGTDSTAQVPEALTLSSTAANLLLDAGEVLSLVRTVAASGLAQPDGIVEVAYQYV